MTVLGTGGGRSSGAQAAVLRRLLDAGISAEGGAVLGAGQREARVLEAAGGSEGGSIDEDGRRNPEGGAVLDAGWREARVLDKDTGSAEGPKRWHTVGGGVGATAVVRAARAESQEGGVRRGIREGRRPVGDAFFYLTMCNDNNAL